jgi:glutamate synthase (NADPH) small chain
MGNPRGFLQIGRAKGPARPVSERLADYRELELPHPPEQLREQASRCMDCGIPFCHKGCPLGNLIPDWNDLVYRDRLDEALVALEDTNNFPEVTGRVCPAPCEAACVLNLNGAPVTIKDVERSLGDHALARPLEPRQPPTRLGKAVAVVGSGPAGLATAQQLARRGYDVTVYERDDRIGGLLRYGIPDFKLEKHLIDRRIEQMRAEGVEFRPGVNVGVDLTGEYLRARFSAVVLATGARQPRELAVPGRDLAGVHLAMDFLEQQNRRIAGDIVSEDQAILATGKRVVILGGGDTGSDCLGTSHRQGATHVAQLELMPQPPTERVATNPWPEWPLVLRTSSSQEEGGDRGFAVMTRQVLGDAQGRVRALSACRVAFEGGKLHEIPGSEHEIPCDLLLLAMGYTGHQPSPLLAQLGVRLNARGNVDTTGLADQGLFAAGDAARGASLVVWAIAEGRKIADAVDAYVRRCSAA